MSSRAFEPSFALFPDVEDLLSSGSKVKKMLVTRVAPVAVLVTLGAGVAVAAGYSPVRASAAPEYGQSVELGVSEDTVRLLPPVAGEDKFVSSLAAGAMVAEADVFAQKELRAATLSVAKPSAGSAVARTSASKTIEARAVLKKAKVKAVKGPAPEAASSNGWKSAKVSWYGPGLYGNMMAGGGTLTPGSMVVAHRSLKFGTRIEFSYQGRTVTAVVQDRGPYTGGRVFDLGPGTAKALGFSGVGTVKYRIVG